MFLTDRNVFRVIPDGPFAECLSRKTQVGVEIEFVTQ